MLLAGLADALADALARGAGVAAFVVDAFGAGGVVLDDPEPGDFVVDAFEPDDFEAGDFEPDFFFEADFFFADSAWPDAEADADAAVPDTAEAPGSVAKLVEAGVVRNTRTPMRPATVPPSTSGVRLTEPCLSG